MYMSTCVYMYSMSTCARRRIHTCKYVYMEGGKDMHVQVQYRNTREQGLHEHLRQFQWVDEGTYRLHGTREGSETGRDEESTSVAEHCGHQVYGVVHSWREGERWDKVPYFLE